MATTPKGIKYPLASDVIKAAGSSSALADDFKELADTSDSAVANGVIEAVNDANGKYGGLPARVTAVEAKNTAQDLRLTDGETKNGQQDTRLTNVENRNAQQDERLDDAENQLAGLASALRTRGSLPAGDLFALTGYNDNGIYSLNSSATYTNAPFATSGALMVINDYQTPGILLAQADNTGDMWMTKTTTAGAGSFTEWQRLTTTKDIDAAKVAIGVDISNLNARALAPMGGEEPYSLLWRDPTGRIAEPAAVDAYGNTPDWVLERWSERMADVLKSDMGIAPRTAIASIGDSMTERYQNAGGQSWTDVLDAKLGVPVVNLGKSGQSTTEIAVRVGAVPFYATVAGNVIPASGAVGLTAYTPTSFWRTTLVHEYSGSLAGVRGILRQNIGDPVTFHFVRDEAGDPVPCPAGAVFKPDQAKYLKWIPTIWMGRNNITDGFVQKAIDDIEAVISKLPFPDSAKKFLVFSVCNSQAEPIGSTGYIRVKAINDYFKAKYPKWYVDVRRWLIDSALGAMGLTPTAADTTAISEDRIPPQLMQDNLHITEAAGLALGDYLVTVINSREILNPPAPLRDTGVQDITSQASGGAITSGLVTFQHKNGWNTITLDNVKVNGNGTVPLFGNNHPALKPWAPGADGNTTASANESITLGSAGTDYRRVALNYTGGLSVYGAVMGDALNGSITWPMNRTMP